MRTVHVAVLCLLVIGSMILLGTRKVELTLAQTVCDIDCLSEKVNGLTKRVAALEKKLAPAKTSGLDKARETFVTINGGSQNVAEWTKLPGSEFWFDQSLYGNVTAVTWQGWIEEGFGQARLYDSSNNRAVDGSEVSVSGNVRASFYSKPLSIWRGQNLYYIQLKNPNIGAVTISTPRLRVVAK